MITRSLGIDELTGLETIHHYDELTDVTHIEHRQDCRAGIEIMKSLHNTDLQQKGCKDGWMHAAWIPDVIQIKWMKEEGIKNIYDEEYWPKIQRLLNSPDYRYLKSGMMKL